MFTNLIDFQKTFSTERKCVKYLEKLRWDNKPICPCCKSDKNACFFMFQGLTFIKIG